MTPPAEAQPGRPADRPDTSPAAAEPSAPPRRPARRHLLGLVGVYAIHLALLLYFAPPSVMFRRAPVSDIDYPLHYYQVDRALEAFSGWGRLWGYDPRVLAGQPAGALEDLSSKSLELFVIGLDGLGVHRALAFNLYILLVHLLLPLLGYTAARLFRLSPWQAVAVSGLWVLLWFFDSLLHWLWFCGMISWAAASGLIVLLVALLYRALDEQRWPWWIGVVAMVALLALLHPFAALILAAPCAALYLRDARRAPLGVHVGIAAAVVAAGATALVWLLPALRMSHYLVPEETFLRPTIEYVLYDFLDLMKNDLQTGPPVRTMLRVLCVVAGGVTLVRWWRAHDRRALPLVLLTGVGLALAYLGGFIPPLRMSQPYRQVAPAALAAAIPAVVLLADVLHPARLRAASRPIQLLVLLLVLLVTPRLAHTVLYYFPELVHEPERPEGREMPAHRRPSMMAGFVRQPPHPLRHHSPPPGFQQIRRWLEKHLDGQGRVVVQEYMLGEYLAATTDLPLLGGLEQRALQHADAHLFRLSPKGDLPGDKLRAYLERYAVKYVVVSHLKRALEWRKDLLQFRTVVGGARIYETRLEPSYFLAGTGRIARQAFNRIEVTGARGPEVVLRFHWMETLRCEPGCRIERYPIAGDRVGFIRVRNPPPAFQIVHSYD